LCVFPFVLCLLLESRGSVFLFSIFLTWLFSLFSFFCNFFSFLISPLYNI
jgi:hypothetical protein